MLTAPEKNRGFSLVELVIVVVILGIIAAIAIPRVSSSSKTAGDSALRANLPTLRNAIDWYYAEHNNTFPGDVAAGGAFGAADSEDALVNQLTKFTSPAGIVSATKDATHNLGPYLRGSFPGVPVGTNAKVATVTVVTDGDPLTGDEATGTGWKYDSTTGQIIANTDELGIAGGAYDVF